MNESQQSKDEQGKGALGAVNLETHLAVKVYAPFKTYYEGQADSLSAVNHTGPFDVLLGHHKFLTILSQGDIVIRNGEGNEEVIPITEGVLFTDKNKVTVFLDI